MASSSTVDKCSLSTWHRLLVMLIADNVNFTSYTAPKALER